jgi:hypothetical protein
MKYDVLLYGIKSRMRRRLTMSSRSPRAASFMRAAIGGATTGFCAPAGFAGCGFVCAAGAEVLGAGVCAPAAEANAAINAAVMNARVTSFRSPEEK